MSPRCSWKAVVRVEGNREDIRQGGREEKRHKAALYRVGGGGYRGRSEVGAQF